MADAEGENPFSFKQAVFVKEKAFNKGDLNYQAFNAELAQLSAWLRQLIRERDLTGYKIASNFTVFSLMTDGIK